MNAAPTAPADPRQRLQQAVAHLEHVLPGQAPILNFVHHNTLHGFQHLPFAQALREAEKITGIFAYQPETAFRRYFAEGRILAEDLQAALAEQPELQAEQALLSVGGRAIARGEVYLIGLRYGIEPLGQTQLAWQLEAGGALRQWQPDLPAERRLLRSADTLAELWQACLDSLGVAHAPLHPEELTDLSPDQAEAIFSRRLNEPDVNVQQAMQAYKRAALAQALDDVGIDSSMRSLLLALTGQDVLEQVRPALIRYLGAYLDEGLAAWNLPQRSEGFYAAWRRLAATDLAWLLAELPGWREQLAALPDDPCEAVAALLRHLQLPEERWAGYLQRIALELPGWSGMVNWRQQRPGYAANREVPVALMDYLALRLFLDQLWLTKLCRDTWHIDATLGALRHHFNASLAEFLVRRELLRGGLPEFLAAKAQLLITEAHADYHDSRAWRALADMIWTWRHTPAAEHAQQRSAGRDGWRLFRLAQHLDLDAAAVRSLGSAGALALLETLERLDRHTRGGLWLSAYERRYREPLFNALSHNHHRRAPKAERPSRPEAQVIFCMDDREESFRRHLEELNPRIETLGAAGFFGVAINWRGLDDDTVTPLCPVVVVPSHAVREQPQPGTDVQQQRHQRSLQLKTGLQRLFHQELRRNLLSSALLLGGLAPLLLPLLACKIFLPAQTRLWSDKIQHWLSPEPPTQLALTAADDGAPATPEHNRQGFTDSEQADRVAGFLRTVGLIENFAPLVVLMGHGSVSLNNPHDVAHDCGACSGRHGGPNARVFAAMANRPEVRRLLEDRGIAIPDSTWFIGAKHNTCNEEISWYDLAHVPAPFHGPLNLLREQIACGCQYSAHERCRRFASAPKRPSLTAALKHVIGRAADLSQVRPEWGHATNAAAFIGRRGMSRGVFFDRRVFLISYDPSQDAEGRILENILLNAGPVGAGINLEYYFSSVNNERFGCGSKTPHNVTGLFGVMEGAASDLRTGLPRQMVEIHEAMRLLVVAEHKPEVLAAIYQRQPPIRELAGNAWLQLAAQDPDTGAISLFDPRRECFVPWQNQQPAPPTVQHSRDWYAGHSDPLPPAFVEGGA